MRLSLRSTQNARYIDHIPAIEAEISAGNSIHEAFCRAGGYPADFLDMLAVGEQSGKRGGIDGPPGPAVSGPGPRGHGRADDLGRLGRLGGRRRDC